MAKCRKVSFSTIPTEPLWFRAGWLSGPIAINIGNILENSPDLQGWAIFRGKSSSRIGRCKTAIVNFARRLGTAELQSSILLAGGALQNCNRFFCSPIGHCKTFMPDSASGSGAAKLKWPIGDGNSDQTLPKTHVLTKFHRRAGHCRQLILKRTKFMFVD